MSIFDKFRKQVATPLQPQATTPSGQEETFSFVSLPESLDQMKALPEAALATPFQTAALTVCALCVYGADSKIGAEMLNWLKGPRPLSN